MDYRDLSDNSRVWIYQADREFTDSEVREITESGKTFVKDWAAHGADLSAAVAVFYNRFIVLLADESQVIASGCSIDASVNFIKNIAQEYQVDLFDRLNIAYKEEDKIKTLQMAQFQEALSSGDLKSDVIVFNNLVETKADFEHLWEVPLKDSWHVQLLPAG